ncbi:MAG: prepilin-type N-terminal cleavage/methylation domain-containing protein [Verrucomicrobiota bacterium JB024]|nr:prepilin-type N-terminal cleavage/methylation domain-containing protein [Verrucomicrobiota bacterium JB024]
MSRFKRGFSLVEMLVSIAVIAVLMVIVIASVGRIRNSANRAQCVNNIRQLGSGILMYAQDDQLKFPQVSAPHWATHIEDFVGAEKRADGSYGESSPFVCPSRLGMLENSRSCHYGINFYLYSDTHGSSISEAQYKLNQVDNPARTILIGDARLAGAVVYKTIQSENLPGLNSSTVYGTPSVGLHGNGEANVCFADGHVETFADASELGQVQYRNFGPQDIWHPKKSR